MTEQTKPRRTINPFWTLPADAAAQRIKHAEYELAQERMQAAAAPADDGNVDVDTIHTLTPPAAPRKKHKRPPPPPEVRELATALGEGPRTYLELRAIIRDHGMDQCRQWATEARAIFEGEGMLTLDGRRRRTLGGIFFQLVKQAGRTEVS